MDPAPGIFTCDGCREEKSRSELTVTLGSWRCARCEDERRAMPKDKPEASEDKSPSGDAPDSEQRAMSPGERAVAAAQLVFVCCEPTAKHTESWLMDVAGIIAAAIESAVKEKFCVTPDAIEQAVTEETERCAKVCRDKCDSLRGHERYDLAAVAAKLEIEIRKAPSDG